MSGHTGHLLTRLLWLGGGLVVGGLTTVGLIVGGASLVSSGQAEAMGPPRFVEETASAGISHVYDGEFEFFVGGGVAVFDCDDDRRPDLYLAGGARPAGLYRNASEVGGELRFVGVPSPVTDLTNVTGAYPLDVDSDGRTDLAVLRVGANLMLRGLGGCRFEQTNDRWGLDGGDEWTTAFSATWEGEAVLPTLAFGNYLRLSPEDQRGSCADHFLFRPAGDTYADPIRLSPGWCTLSILFSDWSRTGQRDLRMTNDRHYYRDGEEQLWEIRVGEPPRLYTRADGWERMQIWGMGIAAQDVTGDGLPEVYLTSQGDNKLQTLASGPNQPTYRDIALASGANAHRPFVGDTDRPSTAWHAEFEDVNNDGLIDLFVTKGNVEAMPEFAMRDPNNLLLGQPDGTFTEAADAAGLLDFGISRGAAVADLNLDGLVDVMVVERREQVRLWRNVGLGTAAAPEPMGSWLAIELAQPGPNRDAIGSWLEVRSDRGVITREVVVGGGHAGGELGWIHLGLGDVDRVELRVRWPDGEVGPWVTLDVDQLVVLERGSTPQPWSPLAD